MHRSILIAALLFLAAGCASQPVAVPVVASTSGRATSEEIDCMSECLSSDDEDCESCVKQCLAPTADAIATVAAKQYGGNATAATAAPSSRNRSTA